jgi:malonate transporter
VATALKLLVMPLLVAAGAIALGIEGPAKMAALICAAVPGASSSYILARQLGGDAPLMANITTAQTLAAMVTMPIMLWVLA